MLQFTPSKLIYMYSRYNKYFILAPTRNWQISLVWAYKSDQNIQNNPEKEHDLVMTG